MRTGQADLPLHNGRAPRWLFDRMVPLARGIIGAIIDGYGPGEVRRRLADPFWFQSLGCVLGFDWHSSGLTTTLTGALKEAVRGREGDLGIAVAGGKGRTSRKAPDDIRAACAGFGLEAEPLVEASKLVAKVDGAAVQDGHQLYHHAFFLAADGQWAVVQQGMCDATGTARRYHWTSDALDADERYVDEPHAALAGEPRPDGAVLDMVAKTSATARARCATLVREEMPDRLAAQVERIAGEANRRVPKGASRRAPAAKDARARHLVLPFHHDVRAPEVSASRLLRALTAAHEREPDGFAAVLRTEGVGPATVRALALVAEVVHGEAPSFRDPVRYSFAHGGKDGHPYPVDRPTYDRTIDFLEQAVRGARVGDRERDDALRRCATLHRLAESGQPPARPAVRLGPPRPAPPPPGAARRKKAADDHPGQMSLFGGGEA